MCQLSYIDLKSNKLNQALFLIMSSVGSSVHDDGWGFTTSNGFSWKTSAPAWCSINSGEILAEAMNEEYSPIMGHIRLASPQIPVEVKNSHPFVSKDGLTFFMHNGKLTPFDEKKFVMEIEEWVEAQNGVSRYLKKEKRSDSLIFFERLQEHWQGDVGFYDSLQKTMDEFHGKFAFLFYRHKEKIFNVVKGKSADLYITHLLEGPDQGSRVIGYAINTSKNVLDMGTNLLGNLSLALYGERLYFTNVLEIPEETVYEAGPTSLIKIREIKENSAPVATSNHSGRGSSFWETEKRDKTKKKEAPCKTKEAKIAKEIWEFMRSMSLSFKDINYILMKLYNISLHEVDEGLMLHFVTKIIPRFKSSVTKEMREQLKSANPLGYVGLIRYSDRILKSKGLRYPWMLSEKNGIQALIDDYRQMK